MKKDVIKILVISGIIGIGYVLFYGVQKGNFIIPQETKLLKNNPTKPQYSDFKIVSYKGVWREYRGLVIIGEIKNEGSIAAGVQIEVIARDKDGVLVDSQTFWPNSIRNILPGGTCGIDFTITEDKRTKTIEAKIIEVRIW